MFSNSTTMTTTNAVSENKMSPDAKWKLLFSSFLNISVEQLDLQVKVDNESLLLTTKDRKIAEQLAKILNSPERLRASLNYTLTEIAHDPEATNVAMTSYPPSMKLERGIGEKVYEQIFGKTTLRRLGYIDWKGEVEREDCFVLQAECDPAYQGFDEPQITKCKEFLSSATFEELRKALSTDATKYQPLPNRRTNDGILAKHIDKIFYRSNDNKTIFLDYGLLIHCTNAPDMEILNVAMEQKEEQTFQIKIDKTHLINYFSIVFKEGFVLNVRDDIQGAEQLGTPILFSIKRTIPLKNVVSLVLDCSGSMHGDRYEYKNHVKGFLEKIAQDNDYRDAEIRIISFSDASRIKLFKMSQLFDMTNYIDSLEMDGGTALNSTINTELSTLLTNARANENVTVVVFTDGVDTGNAYDVHNLKNTTIELSHKQGARPKVFALGLGSNFDERKLQELANLTGGAFIKLTTINDFKDILNHLQDMSHVKEFVTFIQKEVTTFVTPSYVNDICVASASLRIPGAFTVSDKNYQVTKGGIKLIEEKNTEQTSKSSNNSTIDIESLLLSLDINARAVLLTKLLSENNSLPEEKQVNSITTLSAPQRGSLFSSSTTSLPIVNSPDLRINQSFGNN